MYKLAAHFAGVLVSIPLFDPVFESRKVLARFALSLRMFQTKPPLKDSDSCPKPCVLVYGSLHRVCFLRL